MPAPGLAARLNAPMVHWLARKADSSDERVQKTIRLLPTLVEHVDELIGDGVIGGKEQNAADFQIGTSVRVLMTWDDLAPAIEGRKAAKHALSQMETYPNHVPAGYLPEEWLQPLRG